MEGQYIIAEALLLAGLMLVIGYLMYDRHVEGTKKRIEEARAKQFNELAEYVATKVEGDDSGWKIFRPVEGLEAPRVREFSDVNGVRVSFLRRYPDHMEIVLRHTTGVSPTATYTAIRSWDFRKFTSDFDDAMEAANRWNFVDTQVPDTEDDPDQTDAASDAPPSGSEDYATP